MGTNSNIGGTMRVLLLCTVAVMGIAGTFGGTVAMAGDVLVSAGSPPAPFAPNKQNEPTLEGLCRCPRFG